MIYKAQHINLKIEQHNLGWILKGKQFLLHKWDILSGIILKGKQFLFHKWDLLSGIILKGKQFLFHKWNLLSGTIPVIRHTILVKVIALSDAKQSNQNLVPYTSWTHYIKETMNAKCLLLVFFVCLFVCLFVCWVVFNATFDNISVTSCRSVLLVEETRGPGENHWPVASNWQTLSHNVVYLALIEIRTHNISSDRHWIHM
jgi:hypothetical protein